MNIREKVLIVEDEKGISQFIAAALSSRGYEAIQAHTGAEALTIISSHCPDLVILDLGLPDMDGLSILEQLRAWSSLPVVVVSARSHEKDKVTALDLGADDYLTKPFGTDELLARVRALTRRQGEVVSEELVFGDLSLHLSSHCLRRGDKSVRLGFKEFEVLRLLLQNAKLVTPKDDIIAKVWGLDSEAEDNNVEVYISFLRKKLSFLASQVSIGTVRKVGYFLTTSDEPGSFGGGGMP